MTPLRKAIKLAGGLSALAKKLDADPQVVSNWRKRGVPPNRCADVEAAVSGQVTRYQLRPDVFGADPTQKAA